MTLKNAILLLAVAAAVSCVKSELLTDSISDGDGNAKEDSGIEPGLVEIYLSEEFAEAVEKDLAAGGTVTRASSEELSGLYGKMGITSMERVFPYAGEYEPRTRREGLHRWYRVEYDTAVTATRASEELSAVPGVEKTELVMKAVPTSFNDPYLYLQWGYINDGTLSRHIMEGCDINVEPVWENYTKGDRKVIVAVDDYGIDYTHEDLAWNYVGGHNLYNNSDDVDIGSHGTHVAGTIGAVNNNGIGLCGVAGGDYAAGIEGCGLYSCQFFTSSGYGSGSGGNAAIKWGADNGAVISQNSWTSSGSSLSSSTKEAIDYFIKYAGCDNDGNQLPDSPMKGGLVVFAAANDDTETSAWPAAYEEVIAVGALGPDFNRAYYSNYGDWVDICAPGGNLELDNGQMSQIYSTRPDNLYGYDQGTSMACPHVSGVAALVLSYWGGQGFTPDDLKERLLGGANYDAVDPEQKIGPLLDALGAITYGTTVPPDKVTSYSATGGSGSIQFTWNVTADSDDTKAYGYILMAATDRSLLEGIDTKDIPDGVHNIKVKTGSLAVGEEMTGTIDGLELGTDYYVALCGYDYAGNHSDLSEIKTVATAPNEPPVIFTTYTGDYSLMHFQSIEVPIYVEDPEGQDFTIEYTPGSSADTFSTLVFSHRIRVKGNLAAAGTYTGTVTATDSYGASSDFSVTYTILEDNAPQIDRQMEDISYTYIGVSESFNLEDYISDPDGESLTWEASTSDKAVVTATLAGSTLTLTPIDCGTATVSVTATDALGANVVMKFNVTVAPSNTEPVAYPNPVSETLYVAIPANTTATLTLHSSTGSKVYEKSLSVSAFTPAEIDMTPFPSGRYTLYIAYDGNKYSLTITKI